MLVVIFLVGLISIVVGVIFHGLLVDEYSDLSEFLNIIESFFGAIFLVGLLLTGIPFVSNKIDDEAFYQQWEQQRISLVYQLEHNTYSTDENIINGEKQALINKVTNYNVTVAQGKAMLNNKWTGNCYHKAWERLELIDLDLYELK